MELIELVIFLFQCDNFLSRAVKNMQSNPNLASLFYSQADWENERALFYSGEVWKRFSFFSKKQGCSSIINWMFMPCSSTLKSERWSVMSIWKAISFSMNDPISLIDSKKLIFQNSNCTYRTDIIDLFRSLVISGQGLMVTFWTFWSINYSC